MSGTYTEAEDAAFGVINTSFAAHSATLLGYVLDVRWPGVQENEEPAIDKVWTRVSTQTISSVQAAFVTDTINGGSGKVRYTTNGLLFIQFFIPKTDATAKNACQLLGEALQKALRQAHTTPKVIFRNVRLAPLDPEPRWYRFNVITETEYDEVY